MKKTLITLILGFTTIMPVLGETALPENRVSLPTAMEMAVNGNIGLQEKRKSLGIAKYQIKSANKLKNPQIQSNILTGKISNANSSQVGVILPLEIAKRGARKDAAIVNASAVSQSVQHYEFELKLRIRTAYFNLLQAKSELQIMEERKELLEEMLRLAKEKPQSSENYKIEFLQADMRLKKQLIAINRAKANVKTARYN